MTTYYALNDQQE